MAEFQMPTQQELDAITRRTAARIKHQLLAMDTRYDRRSESSTRLRTDQHLGQVKG
jgi:hypothetical protein